MAAAATDRVRAAVDQDLRAVRREYLVSPWRPARLQALAAGLLQRSEDAVMLALVGNVLGITVPLAAAVAAAEASAGSGKVLVHLLGATHLVMMVALLERFVLCMHYSEHRPIFRSRGHNRAFSALMTVKLPWLWVPGAQVLAPLFGVPSGMYYLHHVIMHHVENNICPYDITSTQPYQRDNPLHFLIYWIRFSVGTWVELPLYALLRRRWAVFAQCVAGELAFFGSILLLRRLLPLTTLWVLVLPFAVTSVGLMLGNWSQHIFVDPTSPDSSYSHTYNCVNSELNARGFNDGYHVIHHLNSKLHWADLPRRFLETVDKQAAERSLVFAGIDFMGVGIAVFLGRWQLLARHYVHLGAERPSDAAIVQDLRARLRPVPLSERSKAH